MMDDIFDVAQPCILPPEFQKLIRKQGVNLKESFEK